METVKPQTFRMQYDYDGRLDRPSNTLLWQTVPYNPTPAKPDRTAKLVDDLLAAKKADDAVLDGLTLATVGRLPTEGEKSLTLAAVSKAGDRKAAWLEVAKALAATAEAKKHAADLNPSAAKK